MDDPDPIVDQNVMIHQLKAWLTRTKNLASQNVVVGDLENFWSSMWPVFFSWCEACKECILSNRTALIGTLEWLNTAKRVHGNDGPPSLCYVCWAVIRIRLLKGDWLAVSQQTDDYKLLSQWHPSGMMDSVTKGCVLFHDGKLPIARQLSPIPPLRSSTFMDLYSRMVCVSEPKFDMIASWLHECESSHGHDCNQPLISKDMKRDLTLVDTEQRCLVKCPGTTRYVALSYVWGNIWQLLHVDSNHDVLFQPGGIDNPMLAEKSNAPLGKVITDAMRITSMIGERYLWVDALCIKQDDMKGKAREITRMASIYSGACLTIIPFENASVHIPIPGLGLSGRGILSETILHGVSIGVRIGLLRALRESVYNKRGWCFQEACLSRRSLYFSSQQVFFRCQESVRSEDCIEQWTWDWWAEQSNSLVSYGIINDTSKWKLSESLDIKVFLEGWNTLVSQYWRRTLSVNTDIMDAFTAISDILEVRLGTRISAGLPENIFHHALLWSVRMPKWHENTWHYPGPAREMIQCPGGDLIPSWSWMGWREYCCDDKGSPLESILMFYRAPGPSTLNPGLIPLINSLEIEIRGKARPIETLSAVYSHEATSSCPHTNLHPEINDLEAPQATLEHNIVRFQAHCFSLSSLGLSFKYRPLVVGVSQPHVYGEHYILDSQARHCGGYYGITINDKSCDLYHSIDVIILSATVWNDTKVRVCKIQEPDDRLFDPPYEIAYWKSLNFMLIQWIEDKNVCERLGWGEIHVDALNEVISSQKLVRLR